MALNAGKSARSTRWTRHETTSSSDAPAAPSTVSMLVKVCSVCSARSSLTTLPVFGSNPPWPDRKIQSPTVSPGEYGPAGGGTLSELMRAFMKGRLLEVWQSTIGPGSIHTDRYTLISNITFEVDDVQVLLRPPTSSPLVPRR